MKKIFYKMLFLALFFTLATACYDDKGNYDYVAWRIVIPESRIRMYYI